MRARCAGEEYVRIVGDTRVRQVFQQVALALAPPRCNVFDFGSGPGLDAAVYARHGHTVDAYDHEPKQREYFARHCAELIAEGRVSQRGGTYEEFLQSGDTGWADLITANYAPLNVIADLAPLFKRLHRISRGRAWFLASVLNPLYIPDLRQRWWWRNLGQLIRRGESCVDVEGAHVHRRSVARIAEMAAPMFRTVGTLPLTPRALRHVTSPDAGLAAAKERRMIFSYFMLILLQRVE
jgi:SAM-dependent methyltransferase